MLSPNPVVRCGNAMLPFEAFVHLDDIRLGYIRPERRSLENASGGSRFLIQGSPFRQILTSYPEDKPRVRAGVTPLAEYTHMVDQFDATNPRDKIYGLLGLGMPSDVQFLAPDYSQSVADVCMFVPLLRNFEFPHTSCVPSTEETLTSCCAESH